MEIIGHIALFVHHLRSAESFYQETFRMRLLMRETELEDQLWYTLPPDKDWEDAIAAGIQIGMVALERDDFVLALFQGEPAPEKTVLEIGFRMSTNEISRLRDNLPDSADAIDDEYGDLIIKDSFGYRWHLRQAGDVFQSNGKSSGRWLEV